MYTYVGLHMNLILEFIFLFFFSKKETTSFIPFSVSLGYTITCMHRVLIGILDSERVYTVILVALKCCAALVQATPYYKMQEGLISELVRSTRKFLVHRGNHKISFVSLRWIYFSLREIC